MLLTKLYCPPICHLKLRITRKNESTFGNYRAHCGTVIEYESIQMLRYVGVIMVRNDNLTTVYSSNMSSATEKNQVLS